LAELTRQLLFAPPKRRIAQAKRAEALHDEVDALANYPLDFIWYRITGYRAENVPPTLLTGSAVAPDLRLMIDTLTGSAAIPVTPDEPVESPQQLAARLNVSTKTIARWRQLGLRWRWVQHPGRRHKTIALTSQAVERFMDDHAQRVGRASRHTHVDPATRQAVVTRARRIAQAKEVSLNQVASHLAGKIGRALQTVRVILEQHERDHPQDRIFVDRTMPLDGPQKRAIVRTHRIGTPIGQIARDYKRTRSTIYRAVRHRRASVLRRLRLHYNHSPLFDRDDADRLIFAGFDSSGGPLDSIATPNKKTSPKRQSTVSVDDLPRSIQPLYRGPVMGDQPMRSLLLRLNYLKFKAANLRDQLDRYDPRSADLQRITGWIKQAISIRDRLLAGALPITLSVARRHLIDQEDRNPDRLVELLEGAVPIVAQAIDGFDVTRTQTFEARLTGLLMRRFVAIQKDRPAGGRAHRRLDDEPTLKRIRDAAAQCGIRLVNSPTPDGSN